MQEVFDKITEKLSNSYRNVNSDSDLEWNRAIYECAEIVKEVAVEYNNGWIPVSERLPEEYGNYLCCDEYGGYIIGFPAEEIVDGYTEIFVETDSEIMHDVVAWQPLPEVYQQKGKGE